MLRSIWTQRFFEFLFIEIRRNIIITKVMQTQPSLDNIMKVGWGFMASKVLLAAVQLELFTIIAKKGMTSAKELKETLDLKCTDRSFFDFLDTLVSLDFLNREGILNTAQYSNGRDVDAFLDKGKDAYIGGTLEFANKRCYDNFKRLQIALKTGTPQNELRDGVDLFDLIYQSPEQLKVFINGMDDFENIAYEDFARKFDFTNYNTLLDLGGAGGRMSISVAKTHPHMACETLDLAPVLPIAQENIERYGLTERIKAIVGDFFKAPYPKADVIIMGDILHDWDQSQKEFLIKTAYESLNEGGVLVAIESIIDDQRRTESDGMIMSLIMLVETKGGFNFTFGQYTEWVKAAGFKETSAIRLAGEQSAIIAYK